MKSVDDPRLVKAMAAIEWLKKWEEDVGMDTELEQKDKWKSLLSWESREDVECAVVGMRELVQMRSDHFPGKGVTPCLVNSDVVENTFCQQR